MKHRKEKSQSFPETNTSQDITEETISSKIEVIFGSNSSSFLLFVLGFSTILRVVVGLSYYSGEDMPPKFGDFECHRHWMEFTHHAPVREWYTDGPLMNYSYWPMDYPPLCAYTHWAWSQVIEVVEPNAIKLQ